jgi:arsenate reductase-like glutaredoxin family protein
MLVENPKLIERPILLTDDGRAVIGRSPDALATILNPRVINSGG